MNIEHIINKIVIPIGISLLAGYLIYVGAIVAQADKTASATVCIVGGLLLFAIIYISKFKVVSGLGFRAETWEEKQKEAVELIDQMRELAGIFGKVITADLIDTTIAGMPKRLRFEYHREIVELLKELNVPSVKIKEIEDEKRRRLALLIHYKIVNLAVKQMPPKWQVPIVPYRDKEGRLIAPTPEACEQALGPELCGIEAIGEWLDKYKQFMKTDDATKIQEILE